jgi:hypothetical protein
LAAAERARHEYDSPEPLPKHTVIDQQPEPQPLMSPAKNQPPTPQHAMSAADMCGKYAISAADMCGKYAMPAVDMCGKYAMPAVDICGKCVESLREIPLINFTCDFAMCLVGFVYWCSAFVVATTIEAGLCVGHCLGCLEDRTICGREGDGNYCLRCECPS